ncbi:hypothetical protein [Priestia koreensis]|uniref:Uncharacterized protein n=1 Tax=Priestia koreensis TaxID=284581 RepID=A0A0M0L5R9_9BACI|nr:hypothetical protein [Priestia koreensis]KOO46389.1 hypothetical protein AMD01_11155 [Priestia koreensis]
MFTSKKVQTVGTISEFMTKTKKEHKEISKPLTIPSILPITFPLLATPVFFNTFASSTYAATSEGIKQHTTQQIMHAFDPITSLIQGLAYPITFLSLSYAGILWIINRKEQALLTLQGSAIGFILVSLAPMIMKLLVSVTAGF